MYGTADRESEGERMMMRKSNYSSATTKREKKKNQWWTVCVVRAHTVQYCTSAVTSGQTGASARTPDERQTIDGETRRRDERRTANGERTQLKYRTEQSAHL